MDSISKNNEIVSINVNHDGEENDENCWILVRRRGSIQFKNCSTESKNGCISEGGNHLVALAEWPKNQVLHACNNKGMLQVEVNMEIELVPIGTKGNPDRYEVRYVDENQYKNVVYYNI